MPVSTSQAVRVPSYRHQKSRNLAVVRIDGKDHYLGPYDSPVPTALPQLIYESLARKGSVEPDPSGSKLEPAELEPTINELILTYWRHAEGYYVRDGKPTSELSCIKMALRSSTNSTNTPRPRSSVLWPSRRCGKRWCVSRRARMAIDRDVHRVRRMFKWAASEELSRPRSDQLSSRRFLSSRPHPGPNDRASPARSHRGRQRHPPPFSLSPIVRAMVQLQLLTGSRPGEVSSLRPCRPPTAQTPRAGSLRLLTIKPVTWASAG